MQDVECELNDDRNKTNAQGENIFMNSASGSADDNMQSLRPEKAILLIQAFKKSK